MADTFHTIMSLHSNLIITNNSVLMPPLSPLAHVKNQLNEEDAAAVNLTAIVLGVLLSAFIIAVNIITMVTLYRTPSLQTLSYAYMASLAVSDFIVGVTLLLFSIYQLPHFSSSVLDRKMLLCQLLLGGCLGLAVISTLHMTLIAIDRYIYIIWPYAYPRLVTRHSVAFVLSAVWVFGIIFSAIPLVVGRMTAAKCRAHLVLPVCYTFYSLSSIYAISTTVNVVLYSCILHAAYKQRLVLKSTQTLGSLRRKPARETAQFENDIDNFYVDTNESFAPKEAKDNCLDVVSAKRKACFSCTAKKVNSIMELGSFRIGKFATAKGEQNSGTKACASFHRLPQSFGNACKNKLCVKNAGKMGNEARLKKTISVTHSRKSTSFDISEFSCNFCQISQREIKHNQNFTNAAFGYDHQSGAIKLNVSSEAQIHNTSSLTCQMSSSSNDAENAAHSSQRPISIDKTSSVSGWPERVTNTSKHFTRLSKKVKLLSQRKVTCLAGDVAGTRQDSSCVAKEMKTSDGIRMVARSNRQTSIDPETTENGRAPKMSGTATINPITGASMSATRSSTTSAAKVVLRTMSNATKRWSHTSLTFYLIVFFVHVMCVTPAVLQLGLNYVLAYHAIGKWVTFLALSNSGLNFVLFLVLQAPFRKAVAQQVFGCNYQTMDF